MRTVAIVLILCSAAFASSAAFAAETRRACREACADQLGACSAPGLRHKSRCKRQIVRACRREGFAVCATTTTSTMTSSTTTSTSSTTTITTSTATSTTTSTTLAEPFDWNGVWSFVGTKAPNPNPCPGPETISETVTIMVSPLQILLTGDLLLNPCGEGGMLDDGSLRCFHDLGPAAVYSGIAIPPSDGNPATLWVGWFTAYETNDCSAFWFGDLIPIGEVP